MKKLILATAVTIGALALTACQSTSNSPAPTATSVCTYAGQVGCTAGVGSYGTGVGGVPVGYTGTAGSVGGCTYWTQYYAAYGAYYVPMVDATSGQLECVNVGSSGQTALANAGYTGASPLYYQNQYYNGSGSYGGYGYGGGYYGSDYDNGYYGSGSGLCVGVSSFSACFGF